MVARHGLPVERVPGLYEAAATSFIDGWEESGELWTVAIEQAAAGGEMVELALTLRCASATAAALDRPAAAAVLAAAEPPFRRVARAATADRHRR